MNDVYVLVAYCKDGSGFSLLGVYRFEREAIDRLEVISATAPMMTCKVIRMPVDRNGIADVMDAPLKPSPEPAKAA